MKFDLFFCKVKLVHFNLPTINSISEKLGRILTCTLLTLTFLFSRENKGNNEVI